MSRLIKYLVAFVLTVILFNLIREIYAGSYYGQRNDISDSEQFDDVPDTAYKWQGEGLPYSFSDTMTYPYNDPESLSPLYMKRPDNITTSVEYDPVSGKYVISDKVGGMKYRTPTEMSLQEYSKYEFEKSKREFWRHKVTGTTPSGSSFSFMPTFKVNSETFDKIFGNNTISITPEGNASIQFGFQMSKTHNPLIQENRRSSPSFLFEEEISMNVSGKVGDRLELGIRYNTKATFEFDNKTNLEYVGDEDEIIKKIEAGNVSLPLSGTLISGSQSLFGIKTEMQFGKLFVTNVISHQKGESSEINIEGGAQVSYFEVSALDYDANRHFFLSHYFEEHYDEALKDLRIIKSNMQIEQIEIWITNRNNKVEGARDILALVDLAENNTENLTNSNNLILRSGTPRNESNNLYELIAVNSNARNDTFDLAGLIPGFEMGRDYERVGMARKLTPNEYTFNRNLGYISLNFELSSTDVLAVAYTYTVAGSDSIYKVGELSTNGPSDPEKSLITKLIKGTNFNPQLKTWDLMMKNIYSIGAYQVSSEDFILNILYSDDKKGVKINYIPLPYNSNHIKNEDILLNIFNLDGLNQYKDPYPDGLFDFVPGITILPNNGRIIFPMTRPFGNGIRNYLNSFNMPPDSVNMYVFDEMYDSTKTKALQIAEKNKFVFGGQYKSSVGSEISLNAFNIPQGSVKVTAGGRVLEENKDYTVDYTIGKVRIINKAILESGMPIKVNLESNSLFAFQTKTLLGTHLDYRFSDKFHIAGTVLHLSERPLTKKINIGEEPVSNTIWGMNAAYSTQSLLLTKIVDAIPLIDTKVPSSFEVEGEFANFVPGSSRFIGKTGVAYIDDFEGTETSITLKTPYSWKLASTPQKQPFLFKESDMGNNNRIVNYNRAKLAWYTIDPSMQERGRPVNIKDDDVSSHYTRPVHEKEVFPKKEDIQQTYENLQVFDLAFYPDEKGPYNYVVKDTLGWLSGLEDGGSGKLKDPESRWGGITREVFTKDFEAANIEFIEFWLLDPYLEDETVQDQDDRNAFGSNPAIYFNIGNVSEDVLRDGRKSFENGIPVNPDDYNKVDTTAWGRVSNMIDLKTFNNDNASRATQDVGLDGLSDEQEREFFKDYLDNIETVFGYSSQAYKDAYNDPSNDNYHHYRGTDYDDDDLKIIDRQKNFNGHEGNARGTSVSGVQQAPGTNIPESEDINDDNNMNPIEAYFQYRISLHPDSMLVVGDNYVSDIRTADVEMPNKSKDTARWVQFRVPLREFQTVAGDISDFSSIQFVRLFVKGFKKPVVLRFAEMDFIRSNWRKYTGPLYETSEDNTGEDIFGTFDMGAVNIEKNDGRVPINYILPPGTDRAIDPAQPQLLQLNEQSMVLKVRNLADGDARASYKTAGLDLRQYSMLKMFAHAESVVGEEEVEDNEMTAFIRIGSDYQNNYYEYEVPLKITDKNIGRKRGDNDESYKLLVWPEENNFDVDLEILTELKKERNSAMDRNGTVTAGTVYKKPYGKNKIAIRGNPNLSDIRTIMIGVRNPKSADGNPKSVEVWVNELRLTDFRDKGGWATNMRMVSRLADFGSVAVSGAVMTPGFGGIEQKINERSKENTLQYGASGNFEIGKFLPDAIPVSVPLNMDYFQTDIRPEFNPVAPDLLLRESLLEADSKEEKDYIKDVARDLTTRKGINITNMKVTKPLSKPRFYDPSNLSLTYAYNETEKRNVNIQRYEQINVRGELLYMYNMRPKNVVPFKKVKSLNKPYLRLIKDFNFYYMPSAISYRTNIDRRYMETKLRNLSAPELNDKMPVNNAKNYSWNNYFDTKFDLARALKLDFSSRFNYRINESPERITSLGTIGLKPYVNNPDDIINKKDLLNWHHDIRATYEVPINKIPFLNWMTLNTQANGSFDWIAGLRNVEKGSDLEGLGNSISNSGGWSASSNIRLSSLYNKVPFISKIDRKYGSSKKQNQEMREVKFNKEGVSLKKDFPKRIKHNLNTKQIEILVKDSEGKEQKVSFTVIDENRISVKSDTNISSASLEITGKVPAKEKPLVFIGEQSIRMLTGFKSVGITYRNTNGMTVPGFMGNPDDLLKLNKQPFPTQGNMFLAGVYDTTFIDYARRNALLSNNPGQINPFMYNTSKTFDIRTSYEPFRSLRIDFNASHSHSVNINENYKSSVRRKSGNFTMSYITFGSFENLKEDNNYASKKSDEFRAKRTEVSWFLAQRHSKVDTLYNPRSPYYDSINKTPVAGYYSGYGPTSKEVILPAFLSVYGNRKLSSVIDRFPKIPMPNWSVRFSGLSDLKIVKRYMKTLELNHTYRCRYNIGSYTTNLDYDDINQMRRDLQNNFISEVDINAVSLEEQYSPLIEFSMNWKNNMTTRFEVSKSRFLRLNFANNQLMETHNSEYVAGFGYRIPNVEFQLKTAGGLKKYKSDLNLRADFSVRDGKTVIRTLALTEVDESDQIQTGDLKWTLKMTAEYALSRSFILNYFLDYDKFSPHTQPPDAYSNFRTGFGIRFMLVQ